ncbi:MAG: 1-deoxy-D-xylulose-5-phosphate reductoisomerase [Candidatus Izemoplasmatales bacterium]|jgi:1-deoxy-D-xylulose-5-phosphate reductoisomerase|nr:1-deoxy-D-xylulose-5-phosphate reductoisomerase [Candidatus Izemoplasmatales bacterium]
MRKVYLLGATGSIGKQTIDIIRNNPNDFCLKGISGYNNFNLLKEIIEEFSLEVVSVKNKEQADEIKKNHPELNVFYGEEGLVDLVKFNDDPEALMINALVGMVGLKPTLKAIELNQRILLANKETLVVGGHLIKEALKKSSAKIYPIDSEHSALWQALNGEDISKVKRLVITASGGSFRGKSRAELNEVTVKDALNHPNWSMGNKITIDSATMMNKGFEIIEAAYLFDISIDQVDAILHHESLIHSLVEFVDGSIIAQIANHDMKLPIGYAMYYPLRKNVVNESFDLLRMNEMHFQAIDEKRYPCLTYAKEAYKQGGSMRTVLNAANEVAVRLFLEEKIKFLDIEKIIREEMDKHSVIDFPDIEKIYEIDREIKNRVYQKY